MIIQLIIKKVKLFISKKMNKVIHNLKKINSIVHILSEWTMIIRIFKELNILY